jgi:hypothetical protein
MRRSLRVRGLAGCFTLLAAALATTLPARADQFGGGNQDAYINQSAYVHGVNDTWTASIEYEYECGTDSYGDPVYCYGSHPVNYSVWVTGDTSVTTYQYGGTNAAQQPGGECSYWDDPCGSFYGDLWHDAGAAYIYRGADPSMPFKWDGTLIDSENQHWEDAHYNDAYQANSGITGTDDPSSCNSSSYNDVRDCWNTPTDEEYWDPAVTNYATTNQYDGGDSAYGYTSLLVGENNYGN